MVPLKDRITEVEARISHMDKVGGKCLNEPFANMNSGNRKVMFGAHQEQRVNLLRPEPPLISTGYEEQFALNSSSYVSYGEDITLIAKIQKFSFLEDKNYHYFAIFQKEDGKLDYVERHRFKELSENHCYEIAAPILDNCEIGTTISKSIPVLKSTSLDENDLYCAGTNCVMALMAIPLVQEDGMVVSKSAAKKFESYMMNSPKNIIINENDIPLNLYGQGGEYKCIPDIGEETKNNIVICLRRQVKDEALFSQQISRLSEPMISDDKIIIVNGVVTDINIYCNNLDEISTNPYYAQLYKYFLEAQRVNRELVSVLSKYEETDMTPQLQELYYKAKQALAGVEYCRTDNKKFSNIQIEIQTVSINKLNTGDKITDRYGGKGVVAMIVDDDLMPILDDGRQVEIIQSQDTCINRENPGQLLEVSLNNIGHRIIEYANEVIRHPDQWIEEIYKFIDLCNHEQGEFMRPKIDKMIATNDLDAMFEFMNSVVRDDGVYINIRPYSSGFSLDRLAEIYKAFPYATQHDVYLKKKDSMGRPRLLKADRQITAAKKYFLRLKQFAADKGSQTSLSSINIRGNNTKNNNLKNFKQISSNTPIRMGDMEQANLEHLNTDTGLLPITIMNAMLYSKSPAARIYAGSKLMTDDPWNTNIVLPADASNRDVQILNAFLKTMGIKIEFYREDIMPQAVISNIAYTRQFEQQPLGQLFYYRTAEGLQPRMDLIERNGEMVWNDFEEFYAFKAFDYMYYDNPRIRYNNESYRRIITQKKYPRRINTKGDENNGEVEADPQ